MSDTKYADVTALFPAKRKRRYKEVELPVAGDIVRIHSLTAREVAKFQSATINAKTRRMIQSKLEDSLARLVVLHVVDSEGNVILSQSHVEKLAEWDNADLAYLADACQKHSGMDPDELEGLVKNSGAVPFDGDQPEKS